MIYLDDGGHLISDAGLEELHTFARDYLGFSRRWLHRGRYGDRPHYDLFGKKRIEAILAGARPIKQRESIEILKRVYSDTKWRRFEAGARK